MTISRNLFVIFALFALLTGCATTAGERTVKQQEVLQKAKQELPEEQLLDVWIEQFKPGELAQDKNKNRGLSMEIREAEARYVPVHLRSVMEKTG